MVQQDNILFLRVGYWCRARVCHQLIQAYKQIVSHIFNYLLSPPDTYYCRKHYSKTQWLKKRNKNMFTIYQQSLDSPQRFFCWSYPSSLMSLPSSGVPIWSSVTCPASQMEQLKYFKAGKKSMTVRYVNFAGRVGGRLVISLSLHGLSNNADETFHGGSGFQKSKS